MLHDKHLVIFNDDSQLLHDLSFLLKFLGEQVDAFSYDAWPESWSTQVRENTGLILLCESGSQGQLQPWLKKIRQQIGAVPIIALGEFPQLPDNVDMVERQMVVARLHALPSYNELNDAMHRAQRYNEAQQQAQSLRASRPSHLFRSLVGTSREIQSVRTVMSQVADTDVTVLIEGDSGTGKEVVARNLHYNSPRREGPFVPVNCGAIPAELLESELFGHEKGAFTGAINSRSGRFELAEGGTLFLDEIGDMPLHMQVKILRVLQEKTFERVGGNKSFTTDVRIIAATHRHLEKMIEDGSFREDLYYRLNVFPIEMPSLCDRSEDIPLLINELVSRLESEKRGSIRFNSAAILSLCRHPWPGNVRELANLVERMAILQPYGVVGVQDLPAKYRHLDIEEEALAFVEEANAQPSVACATDTVLLPESGLDLKAYITNLEQSLIQQALDNTGGVVARAADQLAIRRTTLVEKMRKYGLNRH